MCVLEFPAVSLQEFKEKLQCVKRPSPEGRWAFQVQTEGLGI